MSLGEIRAVQLRILQAIAQHCEQNSIRYYLCAGTLLGAVRHQGYVPWDDDIDIMLPRADYERLCATFSQDGANGGLSLRSLSTTASFGIPFAKISDDETLLMVESDVIRGIGVFVDVFPLDGWCNRRLARLAQRAAILLLTRLMWAKHLQLNDKRPATKNVALRTAKVVAVPLSARHLAYALSWVAQRGPYDHSDYAGIVVWGYHESVPRRSYGTPHHVTFEGREYPAPADSNDVLTRLYGDYMTLPPEADRVTHHRFRAYRSG